MTSVKNTKNPVEKKKTLRLSNTEGVADRQSYALVFERAARDGEAGSKRTHMGDYVEQGPAQSTNWQPIEEDSHTVKHSDLMLC